MYLVLVVYNQVRGARYVGIRSDFLIFDWTFYILKGKLNRGFCKYKQLFIFFPREHKVKAER